MEPKPESLWWTSAHKHEDVRTLRVGGRAKLGISLSVKSLKSWSTTVTREGVEGAECAMYKSGWRDKYIYCSKTVPMTTRCRRVNRHVYSREHQLVVDGAMINKSVCMGSKDTASHLQASCEVG